MFPRAFWIVMVAAACGSSASALRAESATIAVAANFLEPLRALEHAFTMENDHTLVIVSGSTGQLYAQILNGAPFDVLLSADQERPTLLAQAGAGVADTQFTYAIGRLALWTRDSALREGLGLDVLRDGEFRWLAIANPDVAPYGVAAVQTLEALGVAEHVAPRIVRGQNIGQTFALVETGNAELGLIALTQAVTYAGDAAYVEVPAELHEPIRQDAILLARAAGNEAARAFLGFLRSAAAARIIEQFGYSAAP